MVFGSCLFCACVPAIVILSCFSCLFSVQFPYFNFSLCIWHLRHSSLLYIRNASGCSTVLLCRWNQYLISHILARIPVIVFSIHCFKKKRRFFYYLCLAYFSKHLLHCCPVAKMSSVILSFFSCFHSITLITYCSGHDLGFFWMNSKTDTSVQILCIWLRVVAD